jgi:predicted dinucleotide-binding enzyme
MLERNAKSVGILGAGKVGTAIARQAMKAGYSVSIATAKPPEDIELIVEFTAPGATATTAEALMRDSDLIVIAVPLAKYRTLDASGLAGKVAIDVMNYWAPTDGMIADFEGEQSSSEVVQMHLPETRLVRTLNHIGYHELEQNALPAGRPGRQALAIAGNDVAARRLVAEFIDRLGFEPVDTGPLIEARALQVGTPIFGARLTRSEMEQALDTSSAQLEPAA